MTGDALEDRILRRNRALREMLEPARGVIADGVVTHGEAAALRRRLEANPEMTGERGDFGRLHVGEEGGRDDDGEA